MFPNAYLMNFIFVVPCIVSLFYYKQPTRCSFKQSLFTA